MEKSLRSLIDWYERAGIAVPELPLERSVRRVKPRVNTAPPPPAPKPDTFAATDPAPIAAGCKTIAELKAALDSYDAGALSDGARQAVLARGTPGSALMVIGEAPGRDEDIQGLPFVGRSGQLLDRMLGAIGLGADDVYISNVCFWRPPNNRKPDPDEIKLCLPFVLRHIELAQPKVLLMTGGTSMQALTGVTGIMRNRGQWQDVAVKSGPAASLPALPIYHPAFLLRRPELKKEAWTDLLTLRGKLAEM